MGAVFNPKDLRKGYNKIIEDSIKDLSPDTKDSLVKLFESWEATDSIEKLKEILGPSKAERLLKEIREKKDVDLTVDEQKTLKKILKDSLTFD
jgi:ADP-dependent phosphofructokinase/glucokinase